MKLEITLKSDLCAGAGKHYSSIIDLDTSLDEYGLPYIPAKRLKGCLREAAAMIFNPDKIDAIFGVAGNSKSAPLSISDAKLENYEVYAEDIIKNKIDDNEVTDLFCSVRNATAIDEETRTAKDKSLRFVRVVNQYSPINNENLKFVSDISVDKEFEEDLVKIAKALRNIGYHRNRGLGAVKCKAITGSKSVSDFEAFTFDDDCMYWIIQSEMTATLCCRIIQLIAPWIIYRGQVFSVHLRAFIANTNMISISLMPFFMQKM